MNFLTQDQYKTMFKWSSVWNLVIGFAQVPFPKYAIKFLFGADAPVDDPQKQNLMQFFNNNVGFYGVSYYLMGRNPKSNRGAIWMGMILKALTFASVGGSFRKGETKLMPFLLTVGDAVWAALFGLFLWDTKDDEQFKVKEMPW